MKKIALALLVISICSTSCKKKGEINCDITFNSPSNGQVYNSGDTVRLTLLHGAVNYAEDSMTLFINQTVQKFPIKHDGGNYEYMFTPIVSDGNTDTINLAAVLGKTTGAVCRAEFSIYVQPL